jgi:hypothetical protein
MLGVLARILTTTGTGELEKKDAKETNADLMAMLLANMAKSDAIKCVLDMRRRKAKPKPDVDAKKKGDERGVPTPQNTPDERNKEDGEEPTLLDELMDCFVRGAGSAYNAQADYDHLAYFFADLTRVSFFFPYYFVFVLAFLPICLISLLSRRVRVLLCVWFTKRLGRH